MTKIKVKVEKTTTGFSAYAEKYAAFTTGKTVAELIANMVESLNLYFEEAKNKKVVTPNDLLFEVDLTSVFEVFPVINMKALSRRLGMNYTLISQYASGKKKPSTKQTEKIVEGINEIGRELSELSLIS
jgi:predicted RNase H-like HicB family nuclease